MGDDIFRQTLGVPMGFSCSPMLAVTMLAFFEIAFVRRLVASTDQPMGTPTDTARAAAGAAGARCGAWAAPPVLWQSWYHLFVPRWMAAGEPHP